MTCTYPATAGTVTNPTGSAGGHDLSHLVDCYSQFQGFVDPPAPGAQAQWQLWSQLSDHATTCDRFRTNKYYQGENTLRIVLDGWADAPNSAPVTPPVADMPLTLAVGAAGRVQTSDGVYRQVDVYENTTKNNCSPGTDILPTSGSVTFTAISQGTSTSTVEASYNLMFGTSQVTGSFVAPFCTMDGCPTRPGTPSCV